LDHEGYFEAFLAYIAKTVKDLAVMSVAGEIVVSDEDTSSIKLLTEQAKVV